jgi:hypothetical protein
MWGAETEILDAGRIRQFRLSEGGERLRYLDVIRLWRSNEMFRAFLRRFKPYRDRPDSRLSPPG